MDEYEDVGKESKTQNSLYLITGILVVLAIIKISDEFKVDIQYILESIKSMFL